MGVRYQKRIKLGPLLQLNISKSGVGLSGGIRGFRFSTGPSGSHIHLGLPGTGLAYRRKLNNKQYVGFAREDTPVKRAEARAAAKADDDTPPEDDPEPGWFASGTEKALNRGMDAFNAGRPDEALPHFLEAADDEPGAAIMTAYLLSQNDPRDYRGIALLEEVLAFEDEFPTELMEKYLASTVLEIPITPQVTVEIEADAMAVIMLLVELYQAHRRVREAMALLESLEQVNYEPALLLSLCELYANRQMWESIVEVANGIKPEDDITLKIAIYYGRAMQAKKLHQAAITVFTQALRRKKGRSAALLNEARYWRADAYQQQGNQRRANEEFQKVYAMDPNLYDVAERVAQLT